MENEGQSIINLTIFIFDFRSMMLVDFIQLIILQNLFCQGQGFVPSTLIITAA